MASVAEKEAYQYCSKLAKSHYENFPVASFLLPKKLRQPISAIYCFARQADDFADEGEFSKEERLQKLDGFWQQLSNIENNIKVTDPLFIALEDTIHKFNLPIQLFYDLLIAFKQDVIKTRYDNFEEILNYCRYSANPVGRLLLHLTNNATEENLTASDKICTALQLINFLQDLEQDIQTRDRCYLPLDEMKNLGLSIDALKRKEEGPIIKQFIFDQTKKASDLLNAGSSLERSLKGIFGLEIRLIIAGGKVCLKKLYTRNSIYDRPTVKSWEILVQSLGLMN